MRGAQGWPPCYHSAARRKEKSEGWKGRQRVHIEEIMGRAVKCTLFALCCVGLFLRHIPPGSDAVIHNDPRRSGVSQVLTLDEKILCLTPLLCSFTSSWFTFSLPSPLFLSCLSFSLCSPFPPAPYPVSPSLLAQWLSSVTTLVLQTESRVSSLWEGCSPKENPPLFPRQHKQQTQTSKCTRMLKCCVSQDSEFKWRMGKIPTHSHSTLNQVSHWHMRNPKSYWLISSWYSLIWILDHVLMKY